MNLRDGLDLSVGSEWKRGGELWPEEKVRAGASFAGGPWVMPLSLGPALAGRGQRGSTLQRRPAPNFSHHPPNRGESAHKRPTATRPCPLTTLPKAPRHKRAPSHTVLHLFGSRRLCQPALGLSFVLPFARAFVPDDLRVGLPILGHGNGFASSKHPWRLASSNLAPSSTHAAAALCDL